MEESQSVGLEKEEAMNRAIWRVGVGEIAVKIAGINPANTVYKNKPGQLKNGLMMMMMMMMMMIGHDIQSDSVKSERFANEQ